MRLLKDLGAHPDNLIMVDRSGVIHSERTDLNKYKREFSIKTQLRTLAEAVSGSDVFIGLSGPNLLTKSMLATMAKNPIVFALSNPIPEITPEDARMIRDDHIMATGRSDYPNQVNNVLGFPYIFRGALDVQATAINKAMILAAVEALRQLAHEYVPKSVLDAYGLDNLEFGKDYIIPKPFDPRLIERLPKAISKAAIDSGIAKTK
jgi:malate dehydrogenase (oxaloacetate-decarboxylating)(NADP+)